MIILSAGTGRSKGCENPKHGTTITKSYWDEYALRMKNDKDLETEEQMKERLFE